MSLLEYLKKRLAFRLQLQDVASLLKGRENINKMTEKLVKDGSEGRRARRIKITFPIKYFANSVFCPPTAFC